MNYRCRYLLTAESLSLPIDASEQVVTAAGFGVAEGAYDDDDHGTTAEFDGTTLPEPYTYYYDDTTPESEMLVAFPDHGLEITAADPLVRGVQVSITITKVDAAGDPVGSGSEQFALSTNRGILSDLTPSLSSGAVTVQYTPPDETVDIYVLAEDPTRVLAEDQIDRTLANP